MGQATSIQWTDATWNPVRGCSRVSPGCENCYAERVAARFSGPGKPYHGLAVMGEHGTRWTRQVRLVREHLEDPLRWRKPRRIFVNSMSDLFHEGLTNEEIAAVFGVMSACSQHTFQVLTKRARGMLEWFEWLASDPIVAISSAVRPYIGDDVAYRAAYNHGPNSVPAWPLPNVWLGVSAEDQERAHKRIPYLLETPAALRFVSYEPALGPVDFSPWLPSLATTASGANSLDWIIVGGESGPGARSFEMAWAEDVIRQGQAAGVACFVKQLGARCQRIILRDSHGGDPAEWPESLRVREFPRGAA